MNRLDHVAIIMDGNGRWAKQKGFLKRIKGHQEGAKRVREITIFASNNNIKYLTLYAFSTENWKRSKEEVDFLFSLMERYLKNELSLFLENEVRFETIGDLSKLPSSLKDMIAYVKEQTKHFKGLTQVLAVNYGSKDEIVRAVNKAVRKGEFQTQESFSQLLDTAKFGDVDLLIRTGGDVRLSNFLLWQCAYAELFFTKTLWPDFRVEEFEQIINRYKKIERRFGSA